MKQPSEQIVLISPAAEKRLDASFMPKLLCLTCQTEEAVPKVGHGTGVLSQDGTQLLCPEGDSTLHSPMQIPMHCGKPMRYFEDEDADQYRVCPD